MRAFMSKKLLVTLGSLATVVLTQVGLPEEVAAKITDAVVWIATAYLAGQGAVDAASALKK